MQVLNLNFYTITFFAFVIGFLIYFFYKSYKNQLVFEKNFSSFFSAKYFFIKFIFLFLAFFSVFLSIFGIKYFSEENKNKSGVDVIFVLDVSKSMNAIDIKGDNGVYTRLDFAKKIIGDFVLKNTENRFGLIIFSGEAKSVLPLTSDTDLFLTFLENVDYKNFENQGSDFKKALELANSRSLYSEEKNRAVIFVSDGGDDEDVISPEISKEKMKNNSYFVLGVGTEKGGKIFLSQDVFGRANFQKYKGKEVLVKLNEKNLKKISKLLDGKYQKVEKISDLKNILAEIEKMEKNIYEKNFGEYFTSFSRIFAFFGLLFFVLFLIFYIFDFKKYVK